MRKASSTSRCSPAPARSPRSSIVVDHAGQLLDRLPRGGAAPRSRSSAISSVTTMRGSCSTTWPSATPSEMRLRREAQRRAARRGSALASLGAGEAARGDHLGQHHGGGLQRLDFLVAILTLGAVLHRQHAEHVAAAQDRHAEERVIDLLAGLRPVGEGRMVLGVGEIERLGLLGAIEPTRPSPSFRRVLWTAERVEAFGGEQLERTVRRAAGRSSTPPPPCWRRSAHDLVEPRPARVRGSRHDLAQAVAAMMSQRGA